MSKKMKIKTQQNNGPRFNNRFSQYQSDKPAEEIVVEFKDKKFLKIQRKLIIAKMKKDICTISNEIEQLRKGNTVYGPDFSKMSKVDKKNYMVGVKCSRIRSKLDLISLKQSLKAATQPSK